MFNNCDPNTNGESNFYNFFIKNNASIIFDVGSRNDTLFDTFEGEVHYFEPDVTTLNQLKLIPHKNNKVYYNMLNVIIKHHHFFDDISTHSSAFEYLLMSFCTL